jgi:hypothetical protein
VVWNEGRWWLTIHLRTDAMVNVHITVADDLGTKATHMFFQRGPVIEDMFPTEFDVRGTKAGRKQPWGRYEVTWVVSQNGKRLGRASLDFYWGVLSSRPAIS